MAISVFICVPVNFHKDKLYKAQSDYNACYLKKQIILLNYKPDKQEQASPWTQTLSNNQLFNIVVFRSANFHKIDTFS